MNLRFLGKSLVSLGRALGLMAWTLLGLWTALAVFFTAPVPSWAATTLALAVMGWHLYAWRHLFRSLAALAVCAVVIVWFCSMTPDANQVWAPEQARMPIVKIEGDKVHVANVRDFRWHSRTEFTEGFYDRVYDMNAINSVYYVVVPLAQLDGVAHVFLCFGFTDGQHVAISVEGRRVKDRPYRVIASMFHQYQLIYVIGDERDVVGVRGSVWGQPVRFYPATSTPERKRALFLDMMQRAHSLEEHPEYYNLITNNCMNNITDHIRALGYRPLPPDWRLLLTGFSDRAAFDLGYFDTDLSFENARIAFRIDEWMRTAPLDEQFSARLRENLARQVAEVRAQAAK
ncbi:MAG: DUF4105 domain-containing protein [Planctomycetota bacterium]